MLASKPRSLGKSAAEGPNDRRSDRLLAEHKERQEVRPGNQRLHWTDGHQSAAQQERGDGSARSRAGDPRPCLGRGYVLREQRVAVLFSVAVKFSVFTKLLAARQMQLMSASTPPLPSSAVTHAGWKLHQRRNQQRHRHGLGAVQHHRADGRRHRQHGRSESLLHQRPDRRRDRRPWCPVALSNAPTAHLRAER